MVLPDLFIDVTSLMVLCFFFNKICTKKRIKRKIYEATTHPIYRSVHRINSFMSLYTFLGNRTLSFDHWTVHVTTSDTSFQFRQNKTNTIPHAQHPRVSSQTACDTLLKSQTSFSIKANANNNKFSQMNLNSKKLMKQLKKKKKCNKKRDPYGALEQSCILPEVAKMMRETLASQRTAISLAFLINPFLLFE